MSSHGSEGDKRGTGFEQQHSTDLELQSDVKKLRVDLNALTEKVDKQAKLLANQVIRTTSIASSIEKITKETRKTAQSVEYSNALVKQLMDELKKPEEKKKDTGCHHRQHHHIRHDWCRQQPSTPPWACQMK